MDNHTATEIAYKNGYEQGKKDAVKHANWEYIADCGEGNCYGHCSNCKTQHKASNPTALKMEYRYCRYCGAKMDGGEAE
jgi:hypothetical protein